MGMLTKTVIVAVALLMFSDASSIAQRGGGGFGGGLRGGRGGGGLMRLAMYLERSWAALAFDLEATEAQLAELRPTYEAAWEARRKALEQPAADPDLQGGGPPRRAMALDQVRADIDAALAEALTDEQLAEWEQLQAATSRRMMGGMGRGDGRGRRGGRGRGAGMGPGGRGRGPGMGRRAGRGGGTGIGPPGDSGVVLGAAPSREVLGARLTEIDPLLREMENTAREYLNVPREHGKFLRTLVEMSGARNALEIGSSNGYSAIWIGLGLETTAGKLTTIEIVPGVAEQARENIRKADLADVVTCVTGDALEVIPRLDQTFDFVFIDAVKSDYMRYFELVRPKLRDGAVIAAHNAISARDAMWQYFGAVESDPDLHTTVVGIWPRDGIAVTYVGDAGSK
jgi:predicted O-methyltransferase YrrM